jgi:CRP-like cAMP-binding protein
MHPLSALRMRESGRGDLSTARSAFAFEVKAQEVRVFREKSADLAGAPVAGRDGVETTTTCEQCVLGRHGCQLEEQQCRPGAVLLRQGEVPAAVWYLKSGFVLVSSMDDGGSETSCSLRGPGALLGLETLLGATIEYEAWALTDVVVCRMGAAEVTAWAKGTGAPALLQLSVEESLRRQHERIGLRGRAVTRLARFLVEREQRGLGPIEIEHQVLARMLGMRAETFSRALAQLEASGAVGDRRTMSVADPVQLRQLRMMAGFTDES